ncbi:hypothetical protein RHSIM_Rhsim04G0171300 [Rhododendron simsii]|uniref:Auxin-responsive protein n=1 Tax=Rhododendron simsii TaxID=118357 RepID=A0A834H3Y4_RHOSS|nr:hypothetical protein RHSIM_Rhsim04G0171300 [Rhododendron simsii]
MEGPSLGLSSGTAENEGELELGLGLSLGGGSVKAAAKGSQWGDYGRILTAKDFPNGQVVGWPPIKAYRMNSLVNQAKSPNPEEDKGVGGDDLMKDVVKKKVSHGSKNSNSGGKEIKGHIGFVKVNMDGLAIGRKVDLNSHSSYDTLAQALEEMFFKPNITVGPIRGEKEQATKPSKLLDGSSDFVLTYEDKEGDWMLVGDVPWGMFLSTVKRLRIMRTSEANGLGIAHQLHFNLYLAFHA